MGFFGKMKEEREKNTAKAKDGKEQINPLLKRVETVANAAAIHTAALELHDGENVEYASTGEYHDSKACLLLTNERIIIASASGLSQGKDIIDYSSVDRVEVGIGLKGSWVALHYGSTSAKLEKSAHGALDEIRDIVSKHKKASSSAPGTDLDQLAKLAELHSDGVLTDEEFAAAKAKALGL